MCGVVAVLSSFQISDIKHSNMSFDSFIHDMNYLYVTLLINICVVSKLFSHDLDSFISVTWLIHTRAMCGAVRRLDSRTLSSVVSKLFSHDLDALISVTWLIHIRDMCGAVRRLDSRTLSSVGSLLSWSRLYERNILSSRKKKHYICDMTHLYVT